ncbi:MAG: MgtC/SapB family protein [Clostridium perfringens]|nr:MgtC/SapB family protein [Clostridium perfringens]
MNAVPTYSIHDIILRIFLAGILAGAIGLERELRSKEAGLRTHFLVGVGSALIMIVSQYGFADVIRYNNISLDPSRIAAQVVSGIGFLGAGTIIIEKKMVRGLTTAAGIWVVAAIGLAAGSGLYLIAILGTVAVLVGLEFFQRIFKLNSHKVVEMNIKVHSKPKNEIMDILNKNSNYILSYKIEKESLDEINIYHISSKFRCKTNLRVMDMVNEIEELGGVISVNVENY